VERTVSTQRAEVHWQDPRRRLFRADIDTVSIFHPTFTGATSGRGKLPGTRVPQSVSLAPANGRFSSPKLSIEESGTDSV